ncbi:MAG: hypothetical protein C5B50_07215 [Verrucomicrobia bacterium]|nr:MAG: hypothetical protein C5B50_07215 [Verrucomicrobiota bacterium]
MVAIVRLRFKQGIALALQIAMLLALGAGCESMIDRTIDANLPHQNDNWIRESQDKKVAYPSAY